MKYVRRYNYINCTFSQIYLFLSNINVLNIGVEVSQEMSERSALLMKQIQDLQRQINNKEKVFAQDHNVIQSVRKVRKQQLEIENNEVNFTHLKEAESEIERIKVVYESELSLLRSARKKLEKECREWKTKYEKINRKQSKNSTSSVIGQSDEVLGVPPAATSSAAAGGLSSLSQHSQAEKSAVKSLIGKFEEVVSHDHDSVSVHGTASSSVPVSVHKTTTSSNLPTVLSRSVSRSATKVLNEPNPINAASEFSKRLQRDDRFKTNSNVKAENNENIPALNSNTNNTSNNNNNMSKKSITLSTSSESSGPSQLSKSKGSISSSLSSLVNGNGAVRSPLGPLRDDGNSPIRLNALAVKKSQDQDQQLLIKPAAAVDNIKSTVTDPVENIENQQQQLRNKLTKKNAFLSQNNVTHVESPIRRLRSHMRF